MKKTLLSYLRFTLLSCFLLLMGFGSRASHIVGCDLFYTWISGNTYKITVNLYGDCGIASSGSFRTLQISTPQVCVYNGGTSVATLTLAIQAPSCGTEITPVCPDSLGRTQCTNTAFSTPGIKKFVYTTTYTFPTTSHNWRLIYTSNNGSTAAALSCGFTGTTTPSSAGRASAITNITAATLGSMQLIDTLDNFYHPNSSPLLTVLPTPFFCLGSANCYNPGAVDPDGDSLRFSLVPATQGSNNCATIGGAVTYSAGLSATNPLVCTGFSFDPATGQICFNPTSTQRGVVVYNVREYRNDTFMGSSQREMTFLVLPCTNAAPTGGAVTTTGVIVPDDTTHFHICGDAGLFSMTMNPREPATPTNNLTITVTGLSGTGMTYVVTSNGTPTPTLTVSGDASTMTPGLYNFFMTVRDDNCPLASINSFAYSINIYPVPTISVSIIKNPTCVQKGVVRITPGGTGKPWTIKVRDSLLSAPLDTIQTYVDSLAFNDTLDPGKYYFHIRTSVSTECGLKDSIRLVAPPKMVPDTSSTNPTFCGGRDGTITLYHLKDSAAVDTITYSYNGVPQPGIPLPVQFDSTITLTNLDAGTYSNIIVRYGYCTSDPIGPVVLTNPPFTWRGLEFDNPTKCGFCNGKIRFLGLHPDQMDTVTYTYNGTPTSLSYFVAADSTIYVSGLCAGTYSNFKAHTAGTCITNTLGGIILVAPPIDAAFDTTLRLGCHGDTLRMTNLSTPASDLTYTWTFGDGTGDTVTNPVHVYTNTAAQTYTVKLYVTNTACVDSANITFTLDNYVNAAFDITPLSNYVCQLTPDTIVNTSTGTSPTYYWDYGDGVTSNTNAPTHYHTYTNTGTYQTMLIAANFVPCYDTAYMTLTVDSISDIHLTSVDSVMCDGQGTQFEALYAHIGDTGNVWTFTDAAGGVYGINNVNPMKYSFDGAKTGTLTGAMIYTVSVTAKYRACPETTATRVIHVFPTPVLNLGPDLKFCPGSNPVVLKDNMHSMSGRERWRWSTDETASSIVVNKPGVYTATLTLDGCSTSDTVTVEKDCYLTLPNVFSPNGDGVNDYFFPRQFLSQGVTKFTMNIYNRWGQLIYETSKTDGLGWDGGLNNVQQPEGVYVYIIDATFKDGQVEHHQGNVTLLR